jgi:hypothetical protein
MQTLPQLTLRDLFWLVALVAMGCGWWVEHSLLCNRMEKVKELHPMLYETMTGEDVQTNRLKPEASR